MFTALLLFISALVGGLQAYNEELNASNFASGAETFLEELVGYQNLTYLNEPGVFDAAKVTSLTVSNITYSFHPPYQYMIQIIDVSNYTLKYNATVQTSPVPTNPTSLKLGLVRDSTTVDLWVPELTFDEYHAAVLTVVIWQ